VRKQGGGTKAVICHGGPPGEDVVGGIGEKSKMKIFRRKRECAPQTNVLWSTRKLLKKLKNVKKRNRGKPTKRNTSLGKGAGKKRTGANRRFKKAKKKG